MGILKIAYLFDYASYEDVLCMNVDQDDVNWLVVSFSTMNKTSNMMLSLFEKGVLIKCSASETCSFLSESETCSFFSENHIVCTFI